LTEVRVKEFADEKVIESDHACLFEVEANADQKPFVKEYELDLNEFKAKGITTTAPQLAAEITGKKVTATVGGSAHSPTLKVVSQTFSQPGDSGAPLLDRDKKIVGLVRSGTAREIYVKGEKAPVAIPTGESQAIFISAALEKLQVIFLSAGQPTAGTRIVVPGMAIQRASRKTIDWEVLDHTRGTGENRFKGTHLNTVARRHVDEVRQLIHYRRRVKVTWYRHKGPGFIAALLRAAPGSSVPVEIDGVRLIDVLRAMRDVLVAEGSQPLRKAIIDHEHEVFDLVERSRSLDDMLAALSTTGKTSHDP
jgi:hypothetical protein